MVGRRPRRPRPDPLGRRAAQALRRRPVRRGHDRSGAARRPASEARPSPGRLPRASPAGDRRGARVRSLHARARRAVDRAVPRVRRPRAADVGDAGRRDARASARWSPHGAADRRDRGDTIPADLDLVRRPRAHPRRWLREDCGCHTRTLDRPARRGRCSGGGSGPPGCQGARDPKHGAGGDRDAAGRGSANGDGRPSLVPRRRCRDAAPWTVRGRGPAQARRGDRGATGQSLRRSCRSSWWRHRPWSRAWTSMPICC